MLLFCDGYDHYNTAAAFLAKYGSALNGAYSVNGSAGRNGTAGMRLNDVSFFGAQGQPVLLPSNITGKLFVGFSWNGAVRPAEQCLVVYMDGTTVQCTVNIQADMKINVRRGNTGSGTIIATSTNAVAFGAHHYFEVGITIHNSAGTIDVKYDGVAVAGLNGLTSQNTRAGSNNYANRINLFGAVSNACLGGSSSIVDIDDMYICDDSGAQNNTFLGDVRVQAIFPNGAGNSTQFTPSAGSNFQNVDETTPNDDTDYNHSATAGHIDLFTMGDISPTSGTIKAVMVWMYARKDDGGSRTIRSVVRSGGTNAVGTTVSVGSSYAYYQGLHELDPAAAAWTISTVNSIEAGYELVS